jgi:hypothetical protein
MPRLSAKDKARLEALEANREQLMRPAVAEAHALMGRVATAMMKDRNRADLALGWGYRPRDDLRLMAAALTFAIGQGPRPPARAFELLGEAWAAVPDELRAEMAAMESALGVSIVGRLSGKET